MSDQSIVALAIFTLTIVATFVLTMIARRDAVGRTDALSDQKLNKWLVGLSAGATANSGFVVTAAVGLGYSFGVQWLLLPLAWLLGDILFWRFFPDKINSFGERVSARTITDLITPENGVSKRSFNGGGWLSLLVGVAIVVCLSGYTAAQWLAGQKFVQGAFGLGPEFSLAAFAVVIIGYTSIGGFRGSIYADSFQALIRLVATALAVGAIWLVALETPSFTENLAKAGPDFLDIFAIGGPVAVIGFVLGYAAAGFGFGLGQPQIVARYVAGRNPSETRAAWWIYIGFVQFTWVAMTAFGVVLRGVLPDVADPEAGLSVFFATYFGPVLMGIIAADIFATIAATSNSLLIAMGQSLKADIAVRISPSAEKIPLAAYVLVLGAISMFLSVSLTGNVFSLALSSVSLLGAALAPVVMARVLDYQLNRPAAATAILVGASIAILWRSFGLNSFLNEAAPGIAAGIATLWVLGAKRAVSAQAPSKATREEAV